MPWDDIARRQHNRDHLRYSTDLTDREWAIFAPLILPAKSGGRPRKTDMREVMNAILYIAGRGWQWRALPKDFPPAFTVRGYFCCWRDIGFWQAINHTLVAATHELEGRGASPTAGLLTVKAPRLQNAAGFPAMTRARRSRYAKRHRCTHSWQRASSAAYLATVGMRLGVRTLTSMGNAIVMGDDTAGVVLRTRVQGNIAIGATAVVLNHGLFIAPTNNDFAVTRTGGQSCAAQLLEFGDSGGNGHS